MAPGFITIEAGSDRRRYWHDLWHYRHLLVFLAWRDILLHYKQTVLGITWAVLRPVLAAGVLTFVFGRLAGLPSEGVPYALMVLAAMIPWSLFASGVGTSTTSLVVNASLITKVFFPRLLVPIAAVAVGLVDSIVALLVVAAFYVRYEFLPDWRVLFLPFALGATMLVTLAFGFWFSALSVRYRDFKYAVPFAIQMALYVSPIAYTSDIVPAEYRVVFALNPMVACIEACRWCLLRGMGAVWPSAVLGSLGVVLVLLGTGLRYFRRAEQTFADVI